MSTPNPKTDLILTLHQSGRPASEIAATVGVTERRVYQVIGVRFKRPRITEKQKREIAEKRQAGVPTRLIAEAMGVSRRTVLAVPAPEDQAFDRRAWTPEELQLVRQAVSSQADLQVVSRNLGRRRSSVQRVVDRIARERERDEMQEQCLQRMQSLGWTVDELWQRIGGDSGPLRYDALQRFLAGQAPLSSRLLAHIVRALGGSLAWK